jgi:hypothetical protein
MCGAKDKDGNLFRMATTEEIKERDRQLEKNAGEVIPALSDEEVRESFLEEYVNGSGKMTTKAERRSKHKK